MPSTCCCVPNCANRGGHLFPKNPKLRTLWIKAIKRSASTTEKFRCWQPGKYSVVCDAHFTPSDYTKITLRGKQLIVYIIRVEQYPRLLHYTHASLLIYRIHPVSSSYAASRSSTSSGTR